MPTKYIDKVVFKRTVHFVCSTCKSSENKLTAINCYQ